MQQRSDKQEVLSNGYGRHRLLCYIEKRQRINTSI